jgi:hypothetical protein
LIEVNAGAREFSNAALEPRRGANQVQDEVKFHSDRAMAEIDLASKSPDANAAEAHLRLSALHLDRVRALSAAARSSSTSSFSSPLQVDG